MWGSGTRLWPLSRAGFPKQFLVLSGTTSLFQQAIQRVNGLAADDIAVGETMIVTGEEHRFIALDQLREMQGTKATLLLEPTARNTAPALTFSALQVAKAYLGSHASGSDGSRSSAFYRRTPEIGSCGGWWYDSDLRYYPR